MITIHLHKLEFFAHHGLYDEEKKSGNKFEINIDICIDAENKIATLDDTVNYVAIYEIVSKRMLQATELLETLAQDLADEIYQYDKKIKSIKININKLSPPINNFKGIVAVSFTKEF